MNVTDELLEVVAAPFGPTLAESVQRALARELLAARAELALLRDVAQHAGIMLDPPGAAELHEALSKWKQARVSPAGPTNPQSGSAGAHTGSQPYNAAAPADSLRTVSPHVSEAGGNDARAMETKPMAAPEPAAGRALGTAEDWAQQIVPRTALMWPGTLAVVQAAMAQAASTARASERLERTAAVREAEQSVMRDMAERVQGYADRAAAAEAEVARLSPAQAAQGARVVKESGEELRALHCLRVALLNFRDSHAKAHEVTDALEAWLAARGPAGEAPK